jgi:hypothetical protein
MKTILNLRRHHYAARVGILLIIVVLIGGMVGCGGGSHTLTINSTAGGSVTTPGVGTFTYDAGTVVTLVATPGVGYQFVRWTGNVSRVADVYTATTNITMNGDYSITANFEYIPMVVAGCLHTVGLKSDGTVVAVGWNDYGECNVGNWTVVVSVYCKGNAKAIRASEITFALVS